MKPNGKPKLHVLLGIPPRSEIGKKAYDLAYKAWRRKNDPVFREKCLEWSRASQKLRRIKAQNRATSPCKPKATFKEVF